MLSFLRKIRKSLIETGSARKYVLYAIGEIALVVLGILIALQVNNWNVNKAEIKSFNLILDEMEENIRQDSIELNTDVLSLGYQITYLEQLIQNEGEIQLDSLNDFLSQFLANRWADFNNTGINQMRNTKNVNAVSPILIEWINRYYTVFENLQNKLPYLWVEPTEDFRQYLIQNKLPPPPLTEDDLNKFQLELNNDDFKNRLKHILSSKQDQQTEFSFSLNYAKALLNVLSNDRKIKFEIALIGTGTGKGWEIDIPLEQIAEHSWIGNLELVDGEVKFRLKNSWFQNWGNISFPKGQGFLDGPDIPVKEGYYRVQFNSNTGAYHFKKLVQ